MASVVNGMNVCRRRARNETLHCTIYQLLHDINRVHQMYDINRVHHVHNLDPTALRRPNMSSKNDVRSTESRLDYRNNSSTELPNIWKTKDNASMY